MNKLTPRDGSDALIIRNAINGEALRAIGRYFAECRDARGNLKWSDHFPNLVTTVGKNHMEDNYLAGSSFTQVGPFMGLISSASYGAGPQAGDTMSSHGGWTEAGSTNAPTFSARLTCAAGWSAASGGSKALSSARSFTMTGNGTLKGSFLVLGAGAVATLLDTNGTLFSAGLFTGGDKPVSATDVVNVSWSLAL